VTFEGGEGLGCEGEEPDLGLLHPPKKVRVFCLSLDGLALSL